MHQPDNAKKFLENASIDADITYWEKMRKREREEFFHGMVYKKKTFTIFLLHSIWNRLQDKLFRRTQFWQLLASMMINTE